MKRLLAHLFDWPLVYVKCEDGDVLLRKVHNTIFDNHLVSGIMMSSTKGKLLSDGNIKNGSYMIQWKPANKHGEYLFTLMKLEN